LLRDPGFRSEVQRRTRRGTGWIEDMEKNILSYQGLNRVENESVDQAVRKWLSKFHKAVLGLKPQIVLYQPVSLMSASTEIDMGFLVKGRKAALTLSGRRQASEEIGRFSDPLAARYEGSGTGIITPMSSVGSPRQYWTGSHGWSDASMKGIHEADRVAVLTIWGGAKAEGQQKGYKGDALLRYTAERAQSIVNETQPTWDTLTSSGLARMARKQTVFRLSILFSSQRNKNANILYRATSEYAHSDRTLADTKKYVKKLVTVGVVQSYAIAGISSLFWALLGYGGRDEDENWLTNWAWSAAEKTLSNWLLVGPVITKTIKRLRNKYDQQQGAIEGVIDDAITVVDSADELWKRGGEDVESGKYRGQSVNSVYGWRMAESGLQAVGPLVGMPFSGMLQLTKRLRDRLKGQPEGQQHGGRQRTRTRSR